MYHVNFANYKFWLMACFVKSWSPAHRFTLILARAWSFWLASIRTHLGQWKMEKKLRPGKRKKKSSSLFSSSSLTLGRFQVFTLPHPPSCLFNIIIIDTIIIFSLTTILTLDSQVCSHPHTWGEHPRSLASEDATHRHKPA